MHRTNIYLDEQSQANALRIKHHYNLRGAAAAVRYALQVVARQIDSLQDSQGRPVKNSPPHQDGKNDA